MDSIKPIKPHISEKLADPEYFSHFFDARTRDEVATQLRELRELRELSQVKFAALSGMHQSAVSRIEQSDYSGWTYKTLLKAAMTLRARLKIEFIPAEKVIETYRAREERQNASYEASKFINAACQIRSYGSTNPFGSGGSVESMDRLGVSGSSAAFIATHLNSDAKVRVEPVHG